MSESLENIVSASVLTKENAVFDLCGELPALTLRKPDGTVEKFQRIIPVRNFPFEYTDKYITVLDNLSNEIGIIISLSDFPENQAEILRKELERRYYMPSVISISQLKEKMGFSNWTIMTNYGEMTFSVRDTYKNVVNLGNGRYIITDVDGNRYEIKDVNALDKKSLRKIELII